MNISRKALAIDFGVEKSGYALIREHDINHTTGEFVIEESGVIKNNILKDDDSRNHFEGLITRSNILLISKPTKYRGFKCKNRDEQLINYGRIVQICSDFNIKIHNITTSEIAKAYNLRVPKMVQVETNKEWRDRYKKRKDLAIIRCQELGYLVYNHDEADAVLLALYFAEYQKFII